MRSFINVFATASFFIILTFETVNAGILQDPNLISISFYESTSGLSMYTFQKNDQRLVVDANQNPPDFANDFRGTPIEYYDVFVSNGDGVLDAAGDYVTIECYFDAIVLGVGNNIDAMSLNYVGGTVRWAQQVSSYVLGINGDPATHGQVMNSLLVSDNVCTYMGCHYSRMTLGITLANKPVVLIHGWNGNSNSWNDFRQWLRNDGLPYIWTPDINPCGAPGEKDFDKNAETLSNFIETNLTALSDQLGYPVREVDIVAHSMGGLVARRYISPGSYDKSWSMIRSNRSVRHLIMLGTPNSGTNSANVTHKLFLKASKVGGPLVDAYTYWKSKCVGPAKTELSSLSVLKFNSRYEDNLSTDYRVVAGTYYNDCLGDQIRSGAGIFEGCPTDGVVGEVSVYRAIPYWPIRSNFPVTRRFTGESRPLKHGELIRNESLAHAVAAELKASNLMDGLRVDDFYTMPTKIDPGDTSFAGISGTSMKPAAPGEMISDTILIPGTTGVTFSCSGYGARFQFQMRSPTGLVYDSTSTLPDSSVIFASDSESVTIFVQSPQTGQWIAEIMNDSLPAPLWPFLLAWNWADDVTIVASVSPEMARTVDTLRVFASLRDPSSPVLGAIVNGTVIAESSDVVIPFVLRDDGVLPDQLVSDGIYSAAILPFISDTDNVVIEILASGTTANGQEFSKEINLGVYIGEGHSPCGDASADGTVDISDAVSLIAYIFSGGSAPSPLLAGDANCDSTVDISDAVYLIAYIFSGGPEPCAGC
jgi:pimeloyl-ACP methyl ester carboxylesterase